LAPKIYLFDLNLHNFAGKQLSEEVVRLGNVLLVFASCCLAGRAYPYGDIPLELQPQAKHQLLKSLTAVHSRNAPDSELPHPYLRSFLSPLFLPVDTDYFFFFGKKGAAAV